MDAKINNNEDFLYNFLITVVSNPGRYIGAFRITNAESKLIQNIHQSCEIKFGDFMEELITEYISLMNYENMNKIFGEGADGKYLSADQLFFKDNNIFLIEQKMRDDHDSTKKRGQYENFKKKYEFLAKKFPNRTIVASMWFVDDILCKNKNYYLSKVAEDKGSANVKLNVFYGGELFDKLFERKDVWDEICSYLKKNKLERSSGVISIPSFDDSEEGLKLLKRLKAENEKIYKKLISDKKEYVQLREELFPTGKNLNKLI